MTAATPWVKLPSLQGQPRSKEKVTVAMSSPRRETPPSYANFSLAKEEPEVVAPSDSTCETVVEKGNAILIGVREFDGSSVKVSEIATKRLERPCVVKPHTDGTCENVGLVSHPLRLRRCPDRGAGRPRHP